MATGLSIPWRMYMPNINCNLPSHLKLEWWFVNFNNVTIKMEKHLTMLTVTNLTRYNSGKYYYIIYDAIKKNEIFTSSYSKPVFVHCEFD